MKDLYRPSQSIFTILKENFGFWWSEMMWTHSYSHIGRNSLSSTHTHPITHTNTDNHTHSHQETQRYTHSRTKRFKTRGHSFTSFQILSNGNLSYYLLVVNTIKLLSNKAPFFLPRHDPFVQLISGFHHISLKPELRGIRTRRKTEKYHS